MTDWRFRENSKNKQRPRISKYWEIYNGHSKTSKRLTINLVGVIIMTDRKFGSKIKQYMKT